ncbi:hypothetical protein NQ318_000856 [Aromia moschata]|uniref:Uncharacterized protein n=1 Tax=Aromia moschata TaxID=1265417 RepID=A0AAV8XBV5_9CUCU|nr:hypothetical protein NQ318_000856 [Aromia moschata]
MESQILRAAGNENKERENKSSDSESGGKGVEVTVGDSQITRFTSVTTIELSQTHDNNIDDTVILRRDPATRRSFINKSAYAKLHRTLSPGRSNGGNINSLKEKYEIRKSDLIDVKNETYNKKTIKTETAKARSGPEPAEDGDGSKPASHVKLDEETVQSLKNKYSPGGFGYPKAPPKPSKLPVPKPRSTVKSQIIFPAHRDSLGENVSSRYSLDVGAKSSSKDENANDVRRKNSSSSGEFISIITRSESEASVDKFEKELSLFTMEGKPREKRKAVAFGESFRVDYSAEIRKRKKRRKYRENAAASDNLQNEANTFNRQSPYRHTTDGSVTAKPRENRVARSVSERFGQPKKNHITKDMEEKYAQMHITQFNNIKQTFEHSESPNMPTTQGYVRMDTPMMKNNPGPISYSNMPNIKKFIDTSSSASTLESDKSNVYLSKERTERGESDKNKNDSPNTVSVRFDEVKKDVRETPPRAQELRQDVRLVNPKALIPINSERPLPNPYQNDKIASSPERVRHPSSFTDNTEMTKKQARPRFEETYGTVFDSVEEYKRENDKTAERRALSNSGDLKKPPRSPSLESSKLKLPSNREIVPLSPRIRSPIPHNDVSTEKIIATELLKPVRTPPSTRKNMSTKFSSPSHQKLEVEIDYPENISDKPTPKNTSGTSTYALSAKPPVSPQTPFGRSPESNSSAKRSTSRNSPSFDSSPRRLNQTYPATESAEKIIYLGYDNGLVSFPADQKKVTTDVLIHANASPTPSALLQNRSLSPARPLSVRSPTPVDTGSSPSVTGSPQKEGMRRSVEAYYWKEIKKLKEQENYDLYLYQMQMMPYGYAEDPIAVRRTRSLSPTTHRNSGRRSLSLPRERRPTNAPTETTESPYGRMQPPQPIPEGRAIVNQQPYRRDVTYGRVQEFQPNFRRNAPERRTIEVTTARNAHTLYKPIFKRGSLTTPLQEFPDDLQNKKVSFSNSRADVQSLQSWPTRNGYTQSPPQRRIDGNRRSTVDDDVFLPPTSQPFSDNNDFYVYANKQSNVLYRPSQNDNVYYRSNQNMTSQNQELPPQYAANPAMRHRQDNGQPYEEYAAYGDADAHSVLLRPSSVQPQEPLYGQRQLVPRRMSYDNANSTVGPRRFREPQYVGQRQRTAPPERDPRYGFKREIIVTDEIFGQFGGYVRQTDEDVYFQNKHIQNPVYSSKQSMVEPVYGRSGTKQVFVRDKVCDIYGQIHDRDSPGVSSPPRHMQKTGVLLGELQRSPGSPSVVRQSYGYLPNERFVRNSRLTASANDIAYRRYENGDPRYRGGGGGGDVGGDPRLSHHQDGGGQAPTRPLPPVPVRLSRHDAAKTPEDDDDIKRGTSIGAKNKKRSFFGNFQYLFKKHSYVHNMYLRIDKA